MSTPFLNPLTPRIVEVYYESPPVFSEDIPSALVERHVECPGGGLEVSVVVPAGRFLAQDQATADAAAEAYADEQSAQAVAEQCQENPPVFQQFDGPFEFPAKAFEGGGSYFEAQTVDGENRIHYDFSFLGIDHSNPAGNIPPASGGVRASAWSGGAGYDLETDSYTGGVHVSLREGGTVPLGSNLVGAARPDRNIVAETADSAFQQIANSFAFSSRSVLSYMSAGGSWITKYFSETPGPSVGGYFAGGAMGAIWVDGYKLVVTNSGPITVEQLGFSIARTGDPARTQHVTGYDPNTRTYTGNKSRAKINVTIPAGKTHLLGEFKFLVTPDDNSTPYTVTTSAEYEVSPDSVYVAYVEFPWIANAHVFYVSGSFSFSPSNFFDFSQVTNTEPVQIEGSTNWPLGADFICPPRNADVWDDFQEATVVDILSSVSTGYGWADNGQFITLNREDCDDDFQSYADQDSILALSGGFGFLELGSIVPDLARPDGVDDFEDYLVGSITSVDQGFGFWINFGEFI